MADGERRKEIRIRLDSSKLRYATKALLYIAATGNGRNVAAREIAAAEQIPEKYLEMIVGELRAGGILESVKGKYGGFRLARRPSEIRLIDVMRILEPSTVGEASGDEPEAAVWEEINQRVTELLSEYTVADALLAEERRKGVVNYII